MKMEKTHEVDFGSNTKDSLKKLNLSTSSLKTWNILEKTGSQLSSMTLPESGMMLSGFVLQRTPLVCHIRGNDCSLFPTPVASDSISVLGKKDRYSLTSNGRIRRHTMKGNNASLNLSRFVRFYPEGPLKSSEIPTPTKELLCPKFVE